MSTIIDGHEDEIDGMNGLELWLSDIATDSATRNLGAVMIGIGGLLGMVIGIMLISGNVSDILSGQMEESGGTADIDGIVISELVGNSSGGDGVEGVEVTLFDDNSFIYELAKIRDEEDFLLFNSLRDEIFRLPPLSGKDLTNSL